ncbi:energy transducer TonB [Gemmatimonas aurantiaca]|uniref:energy transducer TonB n=1 Tax=Gemmatimonas aurantiaca TaxID=173480 RepID=UPI00301B7466
MFTRLPESHATALPSARTADTRAGSSMVSIGMHAALVSALVVITATQDTRRVEEPPAERLRMTEFTPTPPKPAVVETPSTSSAMTPVSAAAPLVPQLPAITDIPTTIPPIDLTRAPVTAEDFLQGGRRGSPNGIPGGTGEGPATSAGYFSADQVEKAVMLLPGSKAPVFPEILRSSGTQGTVLAQFVVDSTGRANLDSFSALRSDHPLFTAAVKAALTRMHFMPAEIGGRRVAQLVQQSFQFQLQ